MAGTLLFLSDGRTERSGVTHEKFVKVSVFSVYYLPSDPIDASINSMLEWKSIIDTRTIHGQWLKNHDASQMKAPTVLDCFTLRGRCVSFYTPRIYLNTPFETNFLPLFLGDCV